MPVVGARWAGAWWRALAAELAATALLVLLGVWSLLPAPGAGAAPRPLTHAALGWGFTVTALAQAFGGASGAHMNPAVTLAALLCGRLAPAAAAGYVAAQAAGGVLGAAVLHALAPGSAAPAAGCTVPAVGPLAAVAVEALLTGTLVLAVCGVWAAERPPAPPDRAAPVKLGLTVAALVYAGGPLSAASLNPARSLGPALVHGYWTHHWVYWAGPLLGAACAAALHRWVLSGASAPEPDCADLPLRDKLEP